KALGSGKAISGAISTFRDDDITIPIAPVRRASLLTRGLPFFRLAPSPCWNVSLWRCLSGSLTRVHPGAFLIGEHNVFFPRLMLLALFAGSAASPDAGPRAAIELYFKAHALGNGDYIRQAFTPDARIQSVDQDQKRQVSTEEFAARFHGPAADEYRRVRRVERLDVSCSAASAVLSLNYPNVLFTDHMSLLKIGGQWKIVNKVFSSEPRDIKQEAIKTNEERSLPFEPRKIIGNIYYVGTDLISSFLIVTPA